MHLVSYRSLFAAVLVVLTVMVNRAGHLVSFVPVFLFKFAVDFALVLCWHLYSFCVEKKGITPF